ncbi:unnamed protein product, partial [Effrenium voratum]
VDSREPTVELGRRAPAIGARSILATSCLRVGGNLRLDSARFENCHNQGLEAQGGALWVGGDLFVGGVVSFLHSSALGINSSGGGAYVWGKLETGGQMRFHNCSSQNGGALAVGGLKQTGDLVFTNCSAQENGGAVRLEGDFVQSGGNVSFHNCSAKLGGALHTQGFVRVSAGQLLASNCQSSGRGGTLWADTLLQTGGSIDLVDGSGIEGGFAFVHFLNQTRGFLSFRRGWSRSGGCLHAHLGYFSAGEVTFSRCFSTGNAGALSAGHGIRGSTGFKASGILRFEHCYGHTGGAVLVSSGGVDLNGSVTFENCTAADDGGALLVQSGDVVQGDGADVAFRNCSAQNDGGALFLASRFSKIQISGGSMLFENCSGRVGGALSSWGPSLLIEGGRVDLKNCRALQKGGGVYIRGNLTQLGGAVHFERCYLEQGDVKFGQGGGAYVDQHIVTHGGSLSLEHCSALGKGGSLYAGRSLQIIGGVLRIFNSTSYIRGGGIEAGDVGVHGGKLLIDSCKSNKGGALFVSGRVGYQQSGGHAIFRNCSMTKIATHNQHAIQIRVPLGGVAAPAVQAHSPTMGGAIYLQRNDALLTGGRMECVQNTAERGGCLYLLKGDVNLEGGSHTFESCKATLRGGAIAVKTGNVWQRGADVSFNKCEATREGGAVSLQNGDYYQSPKCKLEISRCRSFDYGAGLFVMGKANLSRVELFHNFAWGSGMAMASRQEVFIDQLVFLGEGESVVAAPKVTVRWANCSRASQCRFRGKQLLEVGDLLCAKGSGRLKYGSVAGCVPCRTGRVQLWDGINPECVPCPANAICSNATINVRAGLDVSFANLSRIFRCPNKRACPGGELRGDHRLDFVLCAKGYIGDGCTKCAPTHGTSDDDILSCLECATDPWIKGLQIAKMFAKDALMFGFSAIGLMAAENKHSFILLNQYIAFSLAAGSTLVLIQDTTAFRHLTGIARQSLGLSETWGELAPSAGESTDCIASYLGLPKTVGHGQLMKSIFPCFLMLILAVVQDVPSALIVGSNIFLPSLWGRFGRFFVCYRTEPEKAGGRVQCDSLPSGPWLFAAVALLPLVPLLAVLGWRAAVRSEAQPPPGHVVYLTRGYKPECQGFELERLLRKMLLRMLSGMLPVTLVPALHVAGMMLVLLVAFVAYLHNMPYERTRWNVTEVSLATTALLMLTCANCMVANERYWGHSDFTQFIFLFAILSMVGLAALAGAVMLGMQIVDDRRQPKEMRYKRSGFYAEAG